MIGIRIGDMAMEWLPEVNAIQVIRSRLTSAATDSEEFKVRIDIQAA